MTRRREVHGLRHTRLYSIWRGMNQRCHDRNCIAYPHYGGRGICVSFEWSRFSRFFDWANQNGYEDGLTLDRIDGNGWYGPDNCRWATSKQQAENSSIPVLISAFGETKNISDWARDSRCTVTRKALCYRFAQGWEAHHAITKPSRFAVGKWQVSE